MNSHDRDIIEAHKFSKAHRDSLCLDKRCGCFYCLKIFSSQEITEWWDDETTAVCPYCGIDSVIGESSGYPVTTDFLTKMQAYWFNR